MLWADGRTSWLKAENLPTKIQECLKNGSIYQLEQPVTVQELGQTRIEFKHNPTNTKPSTFATVKR